MKRIKISALCFLFVFCFAFLLFGMIFYHADAPTYFQEHSSELIAVKDYVLSYAKADTTEHDTERTVFLVRADGKLVLQSKNEELSSGGQLSDALSAVRQCGFDHIWVEGEDVIFWNDETHTYGLLYSDSPKQKVRAMEKDWYEDMEYRMLTSTVCEIGQLSAR